MEGAAFQMPSAAGRADWRLRQSDLPNEKLWSRALADPLVTFNMQSRAHLLSVENADGSSQDAPWRAQVGAELASRRVAGARHLHWASEANMRRREQSFKLSRLFSYPGRFLLVWRKTGEILDNSRSDSHHVAPGAAPLPAPHP